MRMFFKLAAAAAVAAAMPLSAEAMPVAGASAAPEAGLTLVAGGCGPGFHRGPLLGCRPNLPIVRRPICRTVLLPIPHRICR